MLRTNQSTILAGRCRCVFCGHYICCYAQYLIPKKKETEYFFFVVMFYRECGKVKYFFSIFIFIYMYLYLTHNILKARDSILKWVIEPFLWWWWSSLWELNRSQAFITFLLINFLYLSHFNQKNWNILWVGWFDRARWRSERDMHSGWIFNFMC